MKSCPVKTCEEPVPTDKLMCRYHWFKVPLQLRTAVLSAYHSWRASVGSRTRTPESLQKAGDKLRKAQEAAIQSVNDQLIGKTTA